jgi:hypothetical protein
MCFPEITGSRSANIKRPRCWLSHETRAESELLTGAVKFT